MIFSNNVMVLDTETTGDFVQPLVHDIGYTILDKDLNIVKKVRFLIKEIREIKWLLNYSEFYRKKSALYEKEIQENGLKVITWKKFIKIFKRDIIDYKVKTISAYNIAFDYKALITTDNLIGDKKFIKNLFNRKKILCLWNLSCNTIMKEIDYRDFCERYNFKTDSGNLMTNAETVGKYILRNINFEEEHTSLQDVLLESEILKYIHKHYNGYCQYGLKYNCWKLVNN